MIGFFDSGFGGLTIMKSVVNFLPEYNYLYLGDNARVPYGTRSPSLVYKFTRQAVGFLFNQGCPLIVVACNTASANALRRIQQEYLPVAFPDRRVLGVIRPSAEAVFEKGFKSVGILATEGVVRSGAYLTEIHKLDPAVLIAQQSCPLLVPIVESGEQDWRSTDVVISSYIEKLFEKMAEIEAILLACTHYPILMKKICRHIPEEVSVIEQGPIVAEKMRDYLSRHKEIERKIGKQGKRIFFTTDDCARFDRLACLFYGEHVTSKLISLEGEYE
ncbi:MAG: glutamate racemase [Syntrophales bacterium]|jgi:glutamate racemase|nr:glutamate racemase [Syntrophales bacterium]MDY0043432.1 glutamate racemase [Syntrophales bacterium]